MDSATSHELKGVAHAGTTVELAEIATHHIPELIEQVDDFVAEHESALAPARRWGIELRNELARRIDAEGATQLKLGEHVVRFEKIPARALVRVDMLREPGVYAELQEIVPAAILEKAIRVEHVPARIEYKTHLTFLRKIGQCGERAAEILKRLVDEGVPGRRLVVEREQKRVSEAVAS